MSDNSRYDGKPLLRLLELYILNAIGELPLSEQESLNRLAPKLQAIYGGNGQWHEAVGAAVRVPADMPQLWTAACKRTRDRSTCPQALPLLPHIENPNPDPERRSRRADLSRWAAKGGHASRPGCLSVSGWWGLSIGGAVLAGLVGM